MKTIKIIILIFSCSAICKAQSISDSSRISSNRFSLGFNINQFQHDFGIGLNVTTPYFAKQKVAIRLSGNVQWLQHVPTGSTEATWTPYSTYKAGILGVGGVVSKSIRLYGEGGLVMIFPSSKFSDKTNVFGGYGLFGFEFFMHKGFNYFIELGGMGTGAIAEKSINKPIYSNGFTTTVGFRFDL